MLKLLESADHLDTLTGEQKFSQWVDPYMWHLVYADDVTCDSSAALRGDTLFSLELYNTDSQGEPRNHFGYDERGKLTRLMQRHFIIRILIALDIKKFQKIAPPHTKLSNSWKPLP